MDYNDKNIESNSDHLDNDFFTKVNIPYSKSKDEIWNQLNNSIDNPNTNQESIVNAKHTRIGIPRLVYRFAATILILTGTLIFLRYYNTTIVSPNNKLISMNLPDGSTVTMNANSTLTYYPLWWQFSRKIKLSGEAFFNVEKGNKFNVVSALGETTVLGTSFNIFSRGDEYKVTCMSGKVKVVSITNNEVILTPDYHAETNITGKITVAKRSGYTTDWMEIMFDFTSIPLQQVIKEIELKYNVSITSDIKLDYYYTGFFSKDKPVDEVLNLLCKPFGLTFVKKSESNYHIIQD